MRALNILVTLETKNGIQLAERTTEIYNLGDVRTEVEKLLREVLHNEPSSTKVLSISHVIL